MSTPMGAAELAKMLRDLADAVERQRVTEWELTIKPHLLDVSTLSTPSRVDSGYRTIELRCTVMS